MRMPRECYAERINRNSDMQNGTLLAAVDLGSNSFRLEIGRFAHGQINRTEYLKETVRQGNGLDADRNLTPDAMHRGWSCLARFGERLAGVLGSKHIIFMKNHGVVVTGDTVAQAYRRLYKLERVCRNQILAMGTGQPMAVLSDEVVARVQAPNPDDRHPREERERLYFEAMMRVLDRELPGYAD